MNKQRVVVSMILILFLMWVSPFSSSHSTAASPPITTLCAKGEKVVFSCSFNTSGKIVSLCSSQKLTKTAGYIQYRFGTTSKVELEYPNQRVETQKAFEYSHYFRYQVDRIGISFSTNGYTYNLFYDYNGEEKPAITDQGLTVTPPASTSKKEVNFQCRGQAKADFGDLDDVFENVSNP